MDYAKTTELNIHKICGKMAHGPLKKRDSILVQDSIIRETCVGGVAQISLFCLSPLI